MRRREAGWGVAPAGLVRKQATRAASGLRPCPLRGPARSWLTTLWPTPNAIPITSAFVRSGKRGTWGESAARRCQIAASGAPRGARASFAGRDTIGLRFSARHPLNEGAVGWATIFRCPRGTNDGGHASLCPPYDQPRDAEMRRGKEIAMPIVLSFPRKRESSNPSGRKPTEARWLLDRPVRPGDDK